MILHIEVWPFSQSILQETGGSTLQHAQEFAPPHAAAPRVASSLGDPDSMNSVGDREAKKNCLLSSEIWGFNGFHEFQPLLPLLFQNERLANTLGPSH